MSARPLRPSVWLVPLSAALVYLASLSAIMAVEAKETRLLVVAFLGLSLIAGFVIKRSTALLLPLGVIAIALLWFPMSTRPPWRRS
jgi:hypothetical protein